MPPATFTSPMPATSASRSSTAKARSSRRSRNIGSPQAICISGGATQFLYSSNSNDPESLDAGEIYKVRLSGQVVGKFGSAGKLPKEFGMVNAIDCRTENDLWVGEVWNWRAQKLTLKR